MNVEEFDVGLDDWGKLSVLIGMGSPLEWGVYGGTGRLGSGLGHLAESLLKKEKFNFFKANTY